MAAAALALLLLAGCSGDSDSGDTTPDATPEPVEETPADSGVTGAPGGDAVMSDAPTKIDIDAVRETARTAMFVPAPTEFQAALKASDVDIDIRKLLKDSERTLEGKTRPVIALETGVRMANVLLTAQDGDKATVIARMKLAREGLVALNIPAETMAEVDRVIGDFESDKIGTSELVPALDVLAEQLNDDLNLGTDPNTATLVQAGGWVQGAHLLSSSLHAAGQGGDAAALLHQPTVLAYFKDFLNKAGAGDPAVDVVLAEMDKLEALASKPALTSDDLHAIATHTGTILSSF
jgi:hypothetical protein